MLSNFKRNIKGKENMKKPILINVMIDYSVYFKCERIVKRLHSLGVDFYSLLLTLLSSIWDLF